MTDLGQSGRRNIYTCNKCFGHIVTADVDAGVTHFMLKCRCTPECRGSMLSSMYRVFDQTMRPDFEWYRPSEDEERLLDGNSRDHVSKGGLLLRPARALAEKGISE